MPFDKVVDLPLQFLFAGVMLQLAASILLARVVACDRIFIQPVVQLQALSLFLLSEHRLLESVNAFTG